MRTTRKLAAAALLAAVAAPAVAFERVEIRSKDVVLGSISDERATHEYLIDVPKDAVCSLSLPRQKDSRLQGSMQMYDFGYRSQGLLLIGKRKIQLARPPGVSSRYRAIVQGVNDSQGDYVLKPKVKVQKKYKIRGKRSQLAPPGQIVFGALPGYDVELKVTWAGPDPVTIGSFTAPDQTEMTSEEAAKEKKRSFKQKGFRTTQFGDHRVVLDIPPSATRWTLQVVQKGSPEPRELDLRADHTDPPELDLLVAGDPNNANSIIPLVLVHDETGAGNEIVVSANNGNSPRVIAVFGGDSPSCSFTQVQPGNTPTDYVLLCDPTHDALFTVGSRSPANRILDMVVDPINAPGGSGRTEFPEFVYDGNNRLVGWTEERTFDASGNTHGLELRDIFRFGSQAYTYTVIHTRPDGTTRRYDYLPFN